MRTAITLTKTHAGKWSLAADPDEPLLEQRKDFRSLRASKAHEEFSEVVYQESDGHRETLRLLTPKALAKQEAQAEEDMAEVAKFDEAEAKRKRLSPQREKAEAEFKANEAEAAKVEAAAAKERAKKETAKIKGAPAPVETAPEPSTENQPIETK